MTIKRRVFKDLSEKASKLGWTPEQLAANVKAEVKDQRAIRRQTIIGSALGVFAGGVVSGIPLASGAAKLVAGAVSAVGALHPALGSIPTLIDKVPVLGDVLAEGALAFDADRAKGHCIAAIIGKDLVPILQAARAGDWPTAAGGVVTLGIMAYACRGVWLPLLGF